MKWELLIRRETSLLERYMRIEGYSFMFSSLETFKPKNILSVNESGMTSLFVSANERVEWHDSMLQDFISKTVYDFLPVWQKIIYSIKDSFSKFKDNPSSHHFLNYYNHYKEGRAIVLYSEELGMILESKGKLNEMKKFAFFHEEAEKTCSFTFDKVINILKSPNFLNSIIDDDFMFYTPSELIELIDHGTKLSSNVIESRKDFFVIMLSNGGIKLYTGDKAHMIYSNNIFPEKITDVNKLFGTIANKGVVKSKVRIVNTSEQMNAFVKGEILVSIMTTPRLMEAIQKAVAIVTDEGGLLSHAAISSREFNIPCIVGTKNATNVFKDGDLIEVDANKGVVRKIK